MVNCTTCRLDGHRCDNKKFHPDYLKNKSRPSDVKVELTTMYSEKNTISDKDLSWYKIREISISTFAECCEPIYSILESENKSKTFEDPFLKSTMVSYYSDSFDWELADRSRLKQKTLEMAMGTFHQNIIGKFPGWETLAQGHESGLDNRSLDDTIYLECKNRSNTCNSDQFKEVHNKLKKMRERGKRTIFVQVNCPGGKVCRTAAPPDAEVMNGQEIYKMLSGRDEFFNDLIDTLGYVFKTFKTFKEFKNYIGTA